MTEILEKIYTTRHDHKDALGGGSSGFEAERVALFVSLIGSGKRVLDLGCRDGRIARHLLASGNEVVGFDVDSNALKRCPPGMVTEWKDLNDDWHRGYEGQFDVVVASEVIEHIYYADRTVAKIVAVLKPGGVFIGSVPNAFNIKNRLRLLFGQIQNTPLAEPTHINHFSYQSLTRLLAQQFAAVWVSGIARPRWRLVAKLLPGLGGSLLVFKAQKPKN
ncbi:MAG: hypothetical protein A2571_01365 [Candidatus Vogelbacteria bacterium RIFOXYD1_FULL_44_32]|uniref:Methyltransferase type 11 domain-containing protein n=1 Tax=Candidatus Vogelbacteria bacterium RIFOXYD1_FULL_44_32 TaxID=1802438 RepID=A0A1G2QEK4_9BACT|nr:MAG: hypothetical protein A2571_01365 [Candidatus Vogelbacteria bacterium RIFOXYD1_FULL_44_32]